MNTEDKKSNLSKLKDNWWKIIVLSFVFSLSYALLHGILPSDSNPLLNPSIFVKLEILPLIYIIYGFILFGLISSIFILIQDHLKGNKIVKGLKYGLFFCFITFIVYFEPLPHAGSLNIEMIWMFADGAPYVLYGTFLGYVFANNGNKDAKINSGIKLRDILLILVIPAVFMIGRLISYSIFHIYSSFDALPLNTLLWVFVYGLIIGILYLLLLRPGIKGVSILNTAMWFALIFGIYIFMFNFAYYLIVDTNLMGLVDMFVRSGMDILFAFIGVYTYEYLLKTFKSG